MREQDRTFTYLHKNDKGVYVGHPKAGTLDGNLMHQTKQPNAGKKLTEAQILQIEKDFNAKKLNKGKQKY